MRFALVLLIAIFGIGLSPAKAQQLVVTGKVELRNGSPGGYEVQVYVADYWVNADKTDREGSYTILSDPRVGYQYGSLNSGKAICHEAGKFAYSPLYFKKAGESYVASGSNLKLVSTTEARYTPDQARETIQVLVTVEALLYRARKISTSELRVIDAITVLQRAGLGKNSPARRAIIDQILRDPSLPEDVSNSFRSGFAQ